MGKMGDGRRRGRTGREGGLRSVMAQRDVVGACDHDEAPEGRLGMSK